MVQGVGFRATARHIAHDVGVAGWVRNNSDGTVTLHAEGMEEQIDELRDRLRTSGVGRIEEERESPDATPQGAQSFEIVY